MAEKVLKLAMIGCGNIARAHWHGIQHRAPRIQVTACVDTHAERGVEMAKRTNSVPFTSFEDALKHGDFEAVDLMLPHNEHEWAAQLAYDRGKHVLIEKPIAMDVKSAERILRGAQTAGVRLMVAEQAQYWQDVVRVKELIDEGVIGEVITGKACFYDHSHFKSGDSIPWRFRLSQAGGGLSIDGGAHWIRPMRMMLGEIDEVVAATSRHIDEMEGESLAHTILRFESGVIGSFQALQSTGTVGPVEDFRITGTQGELVIERGRQGRLMVYRNDNRAGEKIMSAMDAKVYSFGDEIKNFCDHVLDGVELAASPEYALGELRTALAIYRSVRSRTWEKVW